jgi:hypothetical protein
MKRGQLGEELVPGRNVDRLNIAAGLDFAAFALDYDSLEDEMITELSLTLWARGEEELADKNWVYYHPHELTSWRMILAHAIATAATNPDLPGLAR